MAAVQKPPSITRRVPDGAPNEFPAGLKVLVVDDDVTCLTLLETMLIQCLYNVTTCDQATEALSLLRKSKEGFDVILSDVHMPDMDGYKLLELVGLEMDLPVIMMSVDGTTSAVMRGIQHGACDYLIKPVRMEELRNIWQHVVRKRWHGNKEHSASLEDSEHNRKAGDGAEHDESDGSWKSQRKKREESENDDGELDNDDISSKKLRVVWSPELHDQFVNAVNQLGIDKAVPKRILELMNVPGITRENVASHLQKYRIFLKRKNGIAQHHGGLPGSFYAATRPNRMDGLDFSALAASSQAPQSLDVLYADRLGRPPGNLAMDRPVLRQALVQGPNCISVGRGIAFGHPLVNSQNMPEQSPWFPMSPSNPHGAASSSNNLGGMMPNSQNGSIPVQMLQQQPHPMHSESHHAINVQPSRLVVPYQTSNYSQVGDNPTLSKLNSMVVPSQSLNSVQTFMNKNSIVGPSRSPSSFQAESVVIPIDQDSRYYNDDAVLENFLLSFQSDDVPLEMGQVLVEDFSNAGVLSSYPIPGSASSSLSSCVVVPDISLPCLVPNLCNIQDTGVVSDALPGQGPGRNLGFLGKGTCNPSRRAADAIGSPINNLSRWDTATGDEGDSEKRSLIGFYGQL